MRWYGWDAGRGSWICACHFPTKETSMLCFGYRELLCRCLSMSPPVHDSGWRGQYSETAYGCPDHQNSFKQASRSDCRNRHVWRSIPDRTWPLTLPCRAQASRVRGATLKYVAASLAVSHFDVCGTSEKLEIIGTTVGLFNHYSNVLGITAYAGVSCLRGSRSASEDFLQTQ